MIDQKKTSRGHGVSDWERMARGLGRQIDDADSVRQALEIIAVFEREVAAGVRRLHDEGVSWTEIATATGVSRQAARMRWSGDDRPHSRCREYHPAGTECPVP